MNICYIGNSVSAQKLSYTHALNKLISQSFKCEKFISCALGGIGSLGISFFIDRFIGENKIEICFLETFAADLGGSTPVKYLEQTLKGILKNPKLKDVKIIPIYLYRGDIDKKQYQIIYQIYNDIFLNANTSPIDIYSHVENEINAGNIYERDLLYDRVHTTPYGSEVYANFIYRHLIEGQSSNQVNFARFGKNASLIPVPLKPVEAYISNGVFLAKRFRLLLPYIQIALNDSIEFATENFSCIGLIVIADHDSGVINIASEDWNQSVQVYDRWCKNERLQVLIFKAAVPPYKKFSVTPSAQNEAEYGANLTINNNIRFGKSIKIVTLMGFNLQ